MKGYIGEAQIDPRVAFRRLTSQTEDAELSPFTINEGTSRSDPSPLHALSWKDEPNPQWVIIKSVLDSGAAESVAPPYMARTRV